MFSEDRKIGYKIKWDLSDICAFFIFYGFKITEKTFFFLEREVSRYFFTDL